MKAKTFLLIAAALSLPLAAHARKSEAEVDKCIMKVGATSMLSPNEEAARKVQCFHGTRSLSEKCERAVGATIRLNQDAERHFRKRCREMRD